MPAVPLPVGTAAPAIRSRVGRGSAVTWRCQSMAIAPVRHGLDALQVRAPLLSHAHGSPGSRPERADDVASSTQAAYREAAPVICKRAQRIVRQHSRVKDTAHGQGQRVLRRWEDWGRRALQRRHHDLGGVGQSQEQAVNKPPARFTVPVVAVYKRFGGQDATGSSSGWA